MTKLTTHPGQVGRGLESAVQDAAAGVGPAFGSRFRRWCGNFWLNFLFLHAYHAPWFVRLAKPFFMWNTWFFAGALRGSLLANARRILGPGATAPACEALGRGILSSFYDFVYDIGRALRMSRRQLLAQIEAVEGQENYARARAPRRGAILVTAHLGSFEVGLAGLREREERVHVLFRRDEKALFERVRTNLRRKLGVIEAPLDEGWPVWVRLRDALLADEVVLMQGDRVPPGHKGEPVDFLGGRVRLPLGPVKLAMVTGSPIVPIFTIKAPGGKVRIVIDDPIMVSPGEGDGQSTHPALTRIAAAIERQVRAHPEQWLVLQKFWSDDDADAGGATTEGAVGP